MALVSYKVATAITPRAITDIDLLANRSFELGSLGAAPDSWTVNGFGAALDPFISETRFWNRGTNPGLRSVVVTNAGGADHAEISQVTAVGTGVAHNLICTFKIWPVGPAQPVLRMDIEGRKADETILEQALTNLSSGFTIGAWNTIEYIASFTDLNITKFKLRIIRIAPTGNGEDTYIDYLHFGLLHDMERNFDFWKLKEVPQGSTHIGNNNHQSINFAAEQMQVEFGYKDVGVFDGSNTDIALLDMYDDVEIAKEATLWSDFSKWTNQERHFERIVMTREYARRRKKGGLDRYIFTMRADAPTERVIVPVVLN